jgi:hypothetical protein
MAGVLDAGGPPPAPLEAHRERLAKLLNGRCFEFRNDPDGLYDYEIYIYHGNGRSYVRSTLNEEDFLTEDNKFTERRLVPLVTILDEQAEAENARCS